MRKLNENEITEMKKRCAGMERERALETAGRYLCEIMVLNWTFRDIEPILFKSSVKGKNTVRNGR